MYVLYSGDNFFTEYIANILESMTSWIANYGYPAVFAVTLLETVFPPIPSEVVFPLVGFTAYSKGLGLGHAIGMAAIGALGSTVGAIMIYFLTLKLGKYTIIRFGKYIRMGESELQKAESWFEKHGQAAVFFGRMAPGVREIISIPAGIGRMNFPKFVIFTYAGSLVWSIALTLAGYYAGKAWNQLSEQLSSVFDIVGIVIIVGIVAAVGLGYYHNRRKKQKP